MLVAFMKKATSVISCLFLLALAAGCSQASSGGEGSAPPMQLPADIGTPIPFSEIDQDTCLAGPNISAEGKALAVDCAEDGAYRIAAITSFGSDAPAQAPSDMEMSGIAYDVCLPHYEGRNAGLTMTTWPDSWQGSETVLICGYQESR